MSKKFICIMTVAIVAMLLTTSCVAATVKGVRGDYDNDPMPTQAEQSQAGMCLGAIFGAIVICSILARGGGLREVVFSVIGLAIGACFLHDVIFRFA
jgi:hypothetical protein